ncbi:Cytochrome P450 71D11 [Glycine soja]|uniref:Cytochrome P450 71D11 n=1 Tax=Glycine soja TaxID=3848 RepID=A0A0B2NPM1_GLYSO|nr:Cytochrome P450 71D11 [Glycine soja]
MDSEVLKMLAVIMSFSLFIFVALKIGSNLKKTDSSPKIPPGPWKIPIIGNIDHFVTSTPHRKLRDLAKIYGPLMHLQLGEIFTIIVLSPETSFFGAGGETSATTINWAMAEIIRDPRNHFLPPQEE